MKKLAILIILVFCSAALSQSGRRIKTQKAAKPKPVLNESSYSESRSYKPRRLYPRNYKPKTEAKTVEVADIQPATDEDGEDVIRVESTLVTIPVSIYDRNGLYIPSVTKQEVKVFEDDVEQEIAYFGTSDKPFTVALLIDTSPSTAYKIKEIRSAAKAFVSQLEPEDSVLVMEFDNDPQVLSEITLDRQKTYKAIDKADFGNGTALYDAVDFALNKRLAKVEGRKAIVLFTDGVDTVSRRSYGSTVRDAEEGETIIYPIYYNTFMDGMGGPTVGINGGIIPTQRSRGYGDSAEEYSLGRIYLEDLSVSTGGRVFRPEATPGGLTRAFEAIAEELRRQYNLGYYPETEGVPGDRKRIKVRVYRPDLIVQARDSYIVGESGTNK